MVFLFFQRRDLPNLPPKRPRLDAPATMTPAANTTKDGSANANQSLRGGGRGRGHISGRGHNRGRGHSRGRGLRGQRGGTSNPRRDWKCQNCQFSNFSFRNECKRCKSPKTSGKYNFGNQDQI